MGVIFSPSSSSENFPGEVPGYNVIAWSELFRMIYGIRWSQGTVTRTVSPNNWYLSENNLITSMMPTSPTSIGPGAYNCIDFYWLN